MAKLLFASSGSFVVLPMWECELWQSYRYSVWDCVAVLPMWECELWQSSPAMLSSRAPVLPMWECELWQSSVCPCWREKKSCRCGNVNCGKADNRSAVRGTSSCRCGNVNCGKADVGNCMGFWWVMSSFCHRVGLGAGLMGVDFGAAGAVFGGG